MSNLDKKTKEVFDDLDKNYSYDNILQMYDNYTYHIELCMIPKDKIREYEEKLANNGPFSDDLKSFLNKNKVIIADTSGCPKFNITSAKMKTYTQSGSIKTTEKSNVHINGYMVETILTVQEVYGFTFINKFDFMCAMLGYQARHQVPVFLNIWFSGYENWNDGYNISEPQSQFMKVKECIGDIQYIYRGVLTDIKTTTSTSTETIYEIKFNSDNYSTDDKFLEACFSYSKVLEIDKNTTNFLGDVANQLEHQINENFLLAQPTAVAQHIYDYKTGKETSIHKPVSFIIYDMDGTKIYDGKNSQLSNDYYAMSKNLYNKQFNEKLHSMMETATDAQKSFYDSVMKTAYNPSNMSIRSPDITTGILFKNPFVPEPKLAAQSDLIKYDVEKLQAETKKYEKKKNKVEESVKENNEKIEAFIEKNKKYSLYVYGTNSVSSINNAITKNITTNPLIEKKDEKIKISCDGQSIDNIFNNILINYIYPLTNKELSGIGACCNIIPHFLAEYEGKCYYNYDIEITIIKIPGLEKVVEKQKEYLETLNASGKQTPMDFSSMQLGFLEDIRSKNVPLKSYKYMYSGSDISVLEYNTDMSQLFYMETGTSLYKALLNNAMNINKYQSDGIVLLGSVARNEEKIYNEKPKDIIFSENIKDKIMKRTDDGHIYMEDIWNSANRLEENKSFVDEVLSKNFNNVAVATNPITDINDISDGMLTMKKIAWNNIFNVACQTANIKIVGDPFWLSPNIPLSANNKRSKDEPEFSYESQMFPTVLFSYIPFVEQQDNDTFKINDAYNYQIVYMVTEINSLFENGQFTQELVCNMPTQFLSTIPTIIQQPQEAYPFATYTDKELKERQRIYEESLEKHTQKLTGSFLNPKIKGY